MVRLQKTPENPKFASSAPWKCCRDPLSPVWSLFNSQVINSSCCARNTAMIIFICREVFILSLVRCNAPDILFIITKDIHSIYKRCHLKESRNQVQLDGDAIIFPLLPKVVSQKQIMAYFLHTQIYNQPITWQ